MSVSELNRQHQESVERANPSYRMAPHVANKIEPGAILYSSWGAKTNIDFYYVVRTTKATAWIVPMSSVHHDNGPGFSPMSVTAGEPQWFSHWCRCRHPEHAHQSGFGCLGAYGQDCEAGCKGFDPKQTEPKMHRIRRWDYCGEVHESLHLTSYSSASLWEGGKLYASHYA